MKLQFTIDIDKSKEWILDRISPEPVSGCWLWNRCVDSNGYAKAMIPLESGEYLSGFAHRIAYQVFNNKYIGSLHLDHKCRVRSCINPDHLEAVTARENILRGIGLSAENSRKTHCKRGHKLSGDNLYIQPNKSTGVTTRQCRECKRARNKNR